MGAQEDPIRRLHDYILPRPAEEAQAPLDWARVFGRIAPLHLEIGPGKGDLLSRLAAAQPESDFVGVEMRRPRVEKCAGKALARGVDNLRLIEGPIEPILEQLLDPGALSAIYVNFPDPWPKRRHHRRRLIQPLFVRLAAERLRRGGRFHLATDHLEYATQCQAVLEACPLLENLFAPPGYAVEGGPWSATIHEAKFRALGREIRYLRFERRAGANLRRPT